MGHFWIWHNRCLYASTYRRCRICNNKINDASSLGIDLLYNDTKFPCNGVQLADCKVATTSSEFC